MGVLWGDFISKKDNIYITVLGVWHSRLFPNYPDILLFLNIERTDLFPCTHFQMSTSFLFYMNVCLLGNNSRNNCVQSGAIICFW